MALVPFNRQDMLAYKPMTNMLDDFFRNPLLPMQNLRDDTFKVDVREEIKHYIVEADMPGVQKKDISIEFRDGRLLIGVQHTESIEEDSAGYVHQERCRTSTQRSIYLAGANGTGITAALTDGVLHINVPKEETAQNTKIEIK